MWLPDSSTWLLRLTAEAPGFVPTDGGSVAQSPVVLGMPAPIAQQFGWPQRKLAWRDVLAKLTGGGGLRPGIIDPARDAAGLAGLLALSGAAGSGATGTQQKVATLRALAANSSSIRDDLMQKFPRAADDLENSLSAAPLSEKDVVAYNKERPQVELAALYLDPAPAALNYPFAVLPEADPQHAAAASGLHAALRQAGFVDTLATAGLRGPDGRTGSGFATPAGAPRQHGARGDRRRGCRRRGAEGLRCDQPVARQLGRDHAARPGARRLRHLRVDESQGADGGRAEPGRGHQEGRRAGAGALRRPVGRRQLGLLDRPGRQAAVARAGADHAR